MGLNFKNILPSRRAIASAVSASLPQASSNSWGEIVKGIDNLPQDELSVHSSNPAPRTVLQFIGPNNAGVVVTHEKAMMVSAIWACIDVISSALSSSDWNVYSGLRGSDNKELIPNDSIQYLLNSRPNPEMTAQAFKRATMIAAVGYGTGYAEIEWDRAGRPAALWPIAPNRCEARRNYETGKLFYRITQDMQGGFVDMNPDDLLIIRGPSLSGVAGDDPIARAVQTVAMQIAVDMFGSSYFANGTQLGGVVSYTGKIDDKTYERMKEDFNARHQGSKKSFKTAFMEGGMTYEAFDSNAKDAMLVETRYQMIEEICRLFRVPPHKIAHLQNATNNNIEHQGLEFSRDTIRPWKIEIEQEVDYKLFAARGPKKFVEIDTDWAQQGDYGSRMTAYSTARAMGVFSPNDVLRKLGENTIGAIGDMRTMNGAAIRIEDVGKQQFANASSATQSTDPTPVVGDPAADSAVLQQWIRTTYARIQRRQSNRESDLAKANRSDAHEASIRDAVKYAHEQMDEMAEGLGEHSDSVRTYAVAVAAGADISESISSALKIEKEVQT